MGVGLRVSKMIWREEALGRILGKRDLRRWGDIPGEAGEIRMHQEWDPEKYSGTSLRKNGRAKEMRKSGKDWMPEGKVFHGGN